MTFIPLSSCPILFHLLSMSYKKYNTRQKSTSLIITGEIVKRNTYFNQQLKPIFQVNQHKCSGLMSDREKNRSPLLPFQSSLSSIPHFFSPISLPSMLCFFSSLPPFSICSLSFTSSVSALHSFHPPLPFFCRSVTR